MNPQSVSSHPELSSIARSPAITTSQFESPKGALQAMCGVVTPIIRFAIPLATVGYLSKASAAGLAVPSSTCVGWIVPVLAQGGIQPNVDRFLTDFLTPVLLLVGVTMIVFGGWRVHRGETGDGLLAIVGGFIVAMAIPMMRLIMQP